MTSPRASIVVHAGDDPADVERAASTAETLRDAFPDATVRVIVNGPALDGAVGDEPLAGVEACAIGMGRRGIDPASLRPGVTVVDSAAVAIVRAQFEGAAYLKI